MAAAVREKFFTVVLESVNHGTALRSQFERISVTSIGALLAAYPSFTREVPDAIEVEGLAKQLQKITDSKKDKVAFVASPAGLAILRTMLATARSLQGPEAAAVGATLAPAPAATVAAYTPASIPATATEAEKHAKASQLFTTAEEVHMDQKWPAHTRVQYSTIAKLHSAAQDRSPVSIPLNEYVLQLQVSSAAKEVYSHMGKEYYLQDGASKVTINSDLILYEQMERRAQANVIAGAFDVEAKALKAKEPSPLAEGLARKESKVQYIVDTKTASGATTPKVHSMACFATPQGQEVEVRAMRTFRKRYPHFSPEKVVATVDVGVQQRIADLMMEGHTRDSAVYLACTKSPELYSPVLVETAVSEDGTATTAGAGTKRKAAGERSPEDALEALKRTLENKEKQIANLQKGRVKGGGGGGGWQQQQGGGKGNGKGGGWQQQWQQPQWQAPQHQQWQGNGGGQANGPGRQPCPPDVCQDFNFKQNGCPRPACKLKHVCAKCGQNHPFRTCPAR